MATSWRVQPEDIFSRSKILPVLVIERVEDAVPLARALVAAGIDIMEVALRTECANDAIRAIRDAEPDIMVGAGSVLNQAMMDEAIDAGANFLVSPGATEVLLKAGQTALVSLIPGVATASEALRAMGHGYEHLKFFHAEASGGALALKGFGGPMPQLTFCPTGGIGADNYQEYLELDNVMSVGGSWVAPEDAIRDGDWSRITQLAKQALAAVK